MEKKFECVGGCKKVEIDMIVFKCNKCIKKTGIYLKPEQANKIVKILNLTPSSEE